MKFIAKHGFEVFLFLSVLVLYSLSPGVKVMEDHANVQVGQALAVIEGQFNLLSTRYPDHVRAEDGALYNIFPPMPSFMLLPLVILFGEELRLTLIMILVGSLNTIICYQILRKVNPDSNVAKILAIAFAFGTVHWWISLKYEVWFMNQIIAVFFSLLVLKEIFGDANPFYLGFFLGCSFLARQATVFLGVFVLGYLFINRDRKTFLKSALLIVLITGILGLIYPVLNYIKFGSLFDTGYRFLPVVWGRSMFSLSYLPYNLYTVLFMAPEVSPVFPYLNPGRGGQAVIFTSPFLVLALLSRLPVKTKMLAWSSVFFIAAPAIFYFNNGYAQFGYRFLLDYLPLLMVLAATAVEKANKALIGVVALSVILNFVGAITLVPNIV
ncbi:MAG: hypothetical protein ABH834_07200 [Candidatus Altiarchaeota archaeon]